MAHPLKLLTKVISHNANHFIIVNVNNSQAHLCTRCTGMIFGLLSTFPFIWILNFDNVHNYLIAGMSVILVLSDLLYWGLTRINRLPDNLHVRIGTGFLLGVGIVIWGQTALPWTVTIIVPILFFVGITIADRLVGKPKQSVCNC